MRIVTKLLNKINVDDNTIVQIQNYNSYFVQLSQVLNKTPTKFVKTFKYKHQVKSFLKNKLHCCNKL